MITRAELFRAVFPLYGPDGILLPGASPVIEISKDGAAPVATTNPFGEVGDGLYSVLLTVAEMDATLIAGRAIDDPASVATIFELVTEPNTYQAKVWIFDDNANGVDRYVAAWFKNGEPYNAGITVPTIQIVKVADGTDLIAETAMVEIGTTGRFRHTEAANRIVSGAAYIAIAKATIDDDPREWTQPIGRDST